MLVVKCPELEELPIPLTWMSPIYQVNSLGAGYALIFTTTDPGCPTTNPYWIDSW